MKTVLSRISMTYVAYVFLLLGFAALGIFVYALAVGSSLAAIIGASLVVFFAASAIGFRAGARHVARTDESGNPIDGANIWVEPVRRAQIDRYLRSYRATPIDVDERAREEAPAELPMAA
ncbi:hypothetical protein Mycch_0801 [Mycolicibacterium chubuense NBB4]|uniref:Uncharacterized protein n=1 Tax=Mycolicibacterium chubuense (strain NBB4) TaxID=710421 RepID=I4BEB0_MYCCN|nr:hypothetical protein [Mycolicibacterium chubuense]AFM15617.1 hypothetical protein Mycch_0801 [Mycolicibacterium chubuense NBB4]